MTGSRGPLRVLHLRDSPWIDGPGRTILETATRINRSRIDYQVGVFVPAPGRPHPLLDALRQRGVPAHEIVDDGTSVWRISAQVAVIADKLQLDILHTSEFRSNLVGILCRKDRAFRLVCTAHGWIANDLWGKLKAFADRCLKRRFDHVILVSRALRKRLPRWWLPDDRVSILHNAVVQERFVSNPSRDNSVTSHRAPGIRLLNVGRLSAEKGHSLLLQAFAELVTEFPDIRLDLAGIGPLASQLAREARNLRIADRVNFLGYVEDMGEVYARTDLVIQSSFTEGLPNVILEAGYLGVPVVATDVGGTSEVIEHGVTGWLIRPRSVPALSDGIRQFVRDPARFRSMARSAIARVSSEFSFAARTMQQEKIYERISGRAS